MDWFPEYWALIAIAIAGATGIVGLLWDVRDKETHKITIWGKALFCITILSTVGAVVAQVFTTRASDARNKKAQEETIQLLTHTRQSIVELSRILQPLDQPTIVLSVDLACGATAYQAFCSSAQSQAAEALANNIKKFDWSTWPDGRGPDTLMFFNIFKNRKKFEEVAKDLRFAGDVTFIARVASEAIMPSYTVTLNSLHIGFRITLKNLPPSMKNTEVMSVPDLQDAVVTIHATSDDFFEIFKPTKIFINTPRGQSMLGSIHVREASGAEIFFAELSTSK
jgi:hypothetical protein